MTPEQYRRARSIFEEACGQSPSRWGDFVEEQAADDPDVAAKVRAMLRRHEHGGGLIDLAERGRVVSLEPSAAPKHPDAIHDYRIIELIGQGGMGRVYKAEQSRPRRFVAIKLLAPGLMSPSMLRRFTHEAEVLGRLQHPGIAAILEAGTFDQGDGAQPYFAMEYIEGASLQRYVDTRDLDVRGRIELVVAVADAVQHAHQRGVIHRDLKPDNVLVDADGAPKILDFGVARVTDADLQITMIQTAVGQIIGTLAYMSPEQCAADPDAIDTRADVYSLGVMLYELITGQPPYELQGRAIHDAVSTIQTRVPPPLSRIDVRFRGDLETIVARALEKNPDDRYQSAHELRDDLVRYLNDEPILARPPSALEQITRLARRHRGAAAALTALVIVLIGATAVSTFFAINAARARDTALLRADEYEAANQFMERVFEQADPWQAGATVSIATALDQAARLVGEEFADQPRVEASVRVTIGRSYFGLGMHQESVAQLERAVELRRVELDPAHPEVLQAEVALARSESADGDRAGARDRLVDALARIEQLRPADPLLIAEACYYLAQALSHLNEQGEAMENLDRALTLRTEILGPLHDETIDVLLQIASSRLAWGQLDEAEASLRKARDALARAGRDEDPRQIMAISFLGDIAYERGDFAAAEQHYLASIALSDNVLESDHPSAAITRSGLASVYKAQGRLEDAEPLSRQVLEMYRESMGPDHHYTFGAMDNLGAILSDQGRYGEAEPLILEALEARRAQFGDDHPAVGQSWQTLGVLAARRGDPEQAVEYTRKSVDVFRRPDGGLTVSAATSLANLGSLLLRLDRHEDAADAFGEVVDYERETLAPDHIYLVYDLNSYARALRQTGRLDDAQTASQEALAILERGDTPQHQSPSLRGTTHRIAGETLLDMEGDDDRAAGAAHLEQAWTFFTEAEQADDAAAVAERLALYFEDRDAEAATTWRERTSS